MLGGTPHLDPAMNAASRPPLKIRRINLDTGRENVVVISRRSKALRPEVFRGFSRVELRCNGKVLLATLILTDDGLVAPDEIGLAEPAFHRFAEPAGSLVTVTPAAPPTASMPCAPRSRAAPSAKPTSPPSSMTSPTTAIPTWRSPPS